jgi:histone H3/H4
MENWRRLPLVLGFAEGEKSPEKQVMEENWRQELEREHQENMRKHSKEFFEMLKDAKRTRVQRIRQKKKMERIEKRNAREMSKGTAEKNNKKRKKYASVVRAYEENQREFFRQYLSACGWDSKKEIPEKHAGDDDDGKDINPASVELFSQFLQDTAYDMSISMDKRPYSTEVDRPSLFKALDTGPKDYVFMDMEKVMRAGFEGGPSTAFDSRGKNKIDVSNGYRHTSTNIDMAAKLGGAKKTTEEAKELIGWLHDRRLANIVQIAAVVAKMDGKKTLQDKHVKRALAMSASQVVV